MFIITRRLSAGRSLLIALAVSALALSCELSSSLLSDSERNSLYSLSVGRTDGLALVEGSVIPPGTAISALVSKKSGAADLAALDFSLASRIGAAPNGLRLLAPSARALSKAGGSINTGSSAVAPASKSVSSIDGRLSGFQIPEGSPPGAYILSVSISDAAGEILQKDSVNIFIGTRVPIIAGVTSFPPSVEPRSSVLLCLAIKWDDLAPPKAPAKLDVPLLTPAAKIPIATIAAIASSDAADEAGDPWIRWSIDGSTFAEGLLSKGVDRVVWTAPGIECANPMRVEVFPSAPPTAATFPFLSPVSQALKVMVIATPGGSGNDFADPLAFFSLFKLDGNFEDSGTRRRIAPPESFGSPVLDTYSSGFGYRFGPSSGLRIPGLMPPGSQGQLGAFSTLLRLDSDQTDGVLVRFSSDDDSYSLVLGIKDSRPYVETQADTLVQRSTGLAQFPFPHFPSTIQASFKPEGEKLTVRWQVEGVLIEAPPLDLPAAPPPGSARLGGSHSLPGIYDGFGLMVGSASPSYRLASRRRWKGSLIIAEAFEDGRLPPSSTAVGAVSAESGSLAIGAGGELTLEPAFPIAAKVIVESDIEGDIASCELVLSSLSHEPILAVRGSGEVLGPSGELLGSLAQPGGGIDFAVALQDGKLYIPGSKASEPRLAVATAAKRFFLSLRREGAGDEAAFKRVLVRTAPLSSKEM